MSFRKLKSTFTDPADESNEEGWIWGNNRGGGGAPLRDAHGNTVTNLKPIVHAHDPQPSQRRNMSPALYDSPKKKTGRNPAVPPLRRNAYEEEDDYYEEPPRGRRQHVPEPTQGRRIPGLDDPYREPPSRSNISPQGSPKKFMSAIQEMNNGSSMNDKLMKQRKEMEYQNALKQQIEENKRKKEEEKRKEDELKRREYEEFMRSRGLPVNPPSKPTGNNNNNSSNNNKRPPFRENDYDEDEDYGGSNVRNRGNAVPPLGKKKGIPGLDFDPAGDDANDGDARYDLPPKKNVRQQQGGLPRRTFADEEDDYSDYGRNNARTKNNNNNNVPPLGPRKGAREDYDDEPPARRGNAAHQGRNKGGYTNNNEDGYDSADYGSDYDARGAAGKGKHRTHTAATSETDYVSVEQYDELSKLCDKLLAQQELLQGEIEQQASVIKSLQKGGGKSSVGKVALAGAGALRSKSAFQQSRSNSVERSRIGGVNGAGGGGSVMETSRSKSAVKPRPSSMYDKKEKDVSSQQQQAKKAMKVAFGHSVVAGDKKKNLVPATNAASSRAAGGNGGRASLGAAAAAAGGKSAMKVQSSPDLSLGKGRAAAAGGGGGGGGGMNGFAKLQLKAAKGPQIVTYEDEGPSAPRGGGGGGELRGQSKYMPIRDDDDGDYPSVGGDQIDRLLNNARKGRFS